MTTRPHTHESPREVLLKHATDAAVICRRHGNEDRARLWDLEAAKLEGRVDSPADMHRRLAEVYESAGAHVVARQHRAVAVAYERVTAADAEAAAAVGSVPVDGREVDRTPDVLTVKAVEDLRDAVAASPPRPLYAISPQEAAAYGFTPQTDGGGLVPPEPPPSPHDGHTIPIPGPVQTGHYWIRDEHVPCFCLIGDDHVAEPRFEKES
jgi:hypothetical protein